MSPASLASVQEQRREAGCLERLVGHRFLGLLCVDAQIHGMDGRHSFAVGCGASHDCAKEGPASRLSYTGDGPKSPWEGKSVRSRPLFVLAGGRQAAANKPQDVE